MTTIAMMTDFSKAEPTVVMTGSDLVTLGTLLLQAVPQRCEYEKYGPNAAQMHEDAVEIWYSALEMLSEKFRYRRDKGIHTSDEWGVYCELTDALSDN